MNKLLKLPLFLGIAGAACGGVLAGVNALTAPIIAEAEVEAVKNGYLDIYKANNYNVTLDDIVIGDSLKISDALYNAGCQNRAIVAEIGVAYTFKVKGYGGDLSFQVAFADGEYLGYTDLGHSETPGYGKDIVDGMNKLLAGKASTEQVFTADIYSGVSKTGKPLSAAIEAARADYNAYISK